MPLKSWLHKPNIPIPIFSDSRHYVYKTRHLFQYTTLTTLSCLNLYNGVNLARNPRDPLKILLLS